MLRRLYIWFLWRHPASFRQRYCDEMLWIYDETADTGNRWGLFRDVAASAIRQCVLRPEFRDPPAQARAVDGAPAFATIEDPSLPPRTVFQGAVVTVLLLSLLTFSGNHGGVRKLRRLAVVPFYEPSAVVSLGKGSATSEEPLFDFSETWSTLRKMGREAKLLIAVPSRKPVDAGTAATAVDAIAVGPGVAVPSAEAARRAEVAVIVPRGVAPAVVATPGVPWDLVLPIAQLPEPLALLDSNRDGAISLEELAESATAFSRMDRNRDGKLSASEFGFNAAGKSSSRAQRLRFMKGQPWLQALDRNRNGVVSRPEWRAASRSLKRLDRDKDGMLRAGELLKSAGK